MGLVGKVGLGMRDGARGGGRSTEHLTVLTEHVEEGLSPLVGSVAVWIVVAISICVGTHTIAGIARAIVGHAAAVHLEKHIASPLAALLRIEVGVGERGAKVGQTEACRDIRSELGKGAA